MAYRKHINAIFTAWKIKNNNMRIEDNAQSRKYAYEKLKRMLDDHISVSDGSEYPSDEGLITILTLKVLTAISLQAYGKCVKEIGPAILSRIRKGGPKEKDAYESYFNYCRDYIAMILLEREIENGYHRSHPHVLEVCPNFDWSQINEEAVLGALSRRTRERVEKQMQAYL